MKKVDVIPVVIGALGTVTKNFDNWLEKLELDLYGRDVTETMFAWNSKNNT